ncbi:MAG: double-strand break repair protein AddB [Rhodospirillaceae bacterium]|nr:double-strand break repair protein AddB [Rhodospirillaceae bacterium]
MTLDSSRPPTVFTIPAGWPFVDALAEGLMAEAEGQPEALAAMTVLLPTRRAGRSLREAFLRLSGGRPMLLPRMMPLGDMEDEDLLIGGWETGLGSSDEELYLPPPIPGLRRQMLLARLVMARPDNAATPEQAMFLAQELARLLDQVHTERRDFAALQDLVPEAFAEHWQITLDFLKLVTELWPGLLQAEGALDPADRRNRLLEARNRLWLNAPPGNPVIAAGSTGSIPATADLLATVARLPQGAVVLPGLDRGASIETWNHLAPSHPQYGMAQLIRHLGIERGDVTEWPGTGKGTGKDTGGDATQPARTALINAALAPAEAGGQPLPSAVDATTALEGISRIDCPGPTEEAAVIALMMRRNLDLPGRTAALVTPDRDLARRVAAELRRWNIHIDDSAGIPLAQTPPGAFLRLIAETVATELTPVALLSLLKHPLATAGVSPSACRRFARDIEIAALRGPRPAPGFDGLRAALSEAEAETGTKIEPASLEIFERVHEQLSPMLDAFNQDAPSLEDLLRRHMETAEALSARDDDSGEHTLWGGEDGEAAAALMADLQQAASAFPELSPREYPAMFEAAMMGRVVRPRFGTHPRLFIWGLLEARLQRTDLVILGSLNEGSWPPEAQANPWMSRPMLETFGLPLPERHVGLTAHDFVQALGAPQVVMTRAERVTGTPTVPSRWLRRMDNVFERLGLSQALRPEEPWLDWVSALDRPKAPRPALPPRPTPPADARPDKLSVTRIETLVRDPYAIYAGQILKLRALDPLQADPGAADRGTIVHRAMDRFIKAFPDDLPADAERHLLEIGREVFESFLTRPGVRALWWPRFQRIASWFVANERRRREQGFRTVSTEATAKLEISGFRGPFTINARADRIDFRADVGYAVIDYKTGAPPTAKQVEAGWNPQLPLEAAMAEAGNFPGLDPAPAAQLVYMRLSGGRQPGEERVLKLDVADVISETLVGVTKLVQKFEDPATPYLSQPRPQFLNRFGDYDHLARVKEWRGRRRT